MPRGGIPLKALILAAPVVPVLWCWTAVLDTDTEQGAIQTLRTIASVQAQFFEGDRCGHVPPPSFARSLMELSNAGLVDSVLGTGRKRGYVYSLTSDGRRWSCTATPEMPFTGGRTLVVRTDGVIRTRPDDGSEGVVVSTPRWKPKIPAPMPVESPVTGRGNP